MTPNRYGLVAHHLGLAVRSPETAARLLAGIGYTVDPLIFDPQQNVHVGLCRGEGLPTMEVVSPGTGKTPLDSVLQSRDSAIYHTCFASDDPRASLDALRADGFEVVDLGAPKPAVLFLGAPVSFHYIRDFGLIEIIWPAPPAG